MTEPRLDEIEGLLGLLDQEAHRREWFGATCTSCGHRQLDENWCEACGHRTVWDTPARVWKLNEVQFSIPILNPGDTFTLTTTITC